MPIHYYKIGPLFTAYYEYFCLEILKKFFEKLKKN